MKIAFKFVRAIDTISEAFGWVSKMLVLLTVAVGFYNVAARYLGEFVGAQLSSNIFIEIQWYLYSLVFFFGFSYILKNGINVRVDFFFENFSPKRKAWIDLVGHILFLVPFCLLGIYVSIDPVLKSWGMLPNGTFGPWELSPDPNGLPRAPIKSMIIVAFLFLLLQTLAELVKLVAIIRDRQDLVDANKLEKDAPLRVE